MCVCVCVVLIKMWIPLYDLVVLPETLCDEFTISIKFTEITYIFIKYYYRFLQNKIWIVRFEVPTTVLLQIQVFREGYYAIAAYM